MKGKKDRSAEGVSECLVLLGFTRGDLQMAVCSKPNSTTEQPHVVFLRGVRSSGGKIVADCPRCRAEHEVEEDLFQAIADGWVDVNRSCDAGATLIELVDIYAIRLAETRKATSKRRAS